jgi:hypothetical protein
MGSAISVISEVLFALGMVFGPVSGYVDQYFIFKRTKDSGGFSIVTCGILLICNILRVYFWVGSRFDNVLLIQSLVMIAFQLILLHSVVRYRPITLPSSAPQHNRPRCFHWDTYAKYIHFLVGFTVLVGCLYLLLSGIPVFIEILGIISLGIEATVPLPQAISNYKRKSVEGFSLYVMAMWFGGDSFKLFYFIFTGSPFQFIMCGAVQLSIDMVILGQFVLYDMKVRRFLRLEGYVEVEEREERAANDEEHSEFE